MQSIRRVAVIGGNRIPFARSNSRYANASNADLLGAALDGLIARYGLAGQRVGEVVAGAVLKHSRDFNLTREVVLGSQLDPHTPAYDIQQACGTGLEATILVANKIALGQLDVGIAGGVDTTSDAPLAVNEEMRRTLLKLNCGPYPRRTAQDRREAAPTPAVQAGDPAQRRAAYRPVDGRPRRPHRAALADRPAVPGRAGAALAPAPRRRVRPGFLRRPDDAVPGADPRCEPPPRQQPGEARRAEAGLRHPRPGRRAGHHDRRQLVAADRRRVHRAAGQRGVGARRTSCPCWPGSAGRRRRRWTSCTATRGC